MLLYLYAIQSLAFAVTHLVSSRHLAVGLTGLACLCLSLASGLTVHYEEVGVWASWLRFASPQWWMQRPLLVDELNPVVSAGSPSGERFNIPFSCTRNPGKKSKLRRGNIDNVPKEIC